MTSKDISFFEVSGWQNVDEKHPIGSENLDIELYLKACGFFLELGPLQASQVNL